MRLPAIALCLFANATLAHAAEYHVAATGDDAGAGGAATPWRSIAKAAAVAVAGDTVTVHEGVWREAVVPAHSGAAGAPIVFQAAPGEAVVISGADPITGWTTSTGQTWVADMPAAWFDRATPGDGVHLWDPAVGNETDLVLCDGRLMPLARWPDSAPGCADELDPTRPAKSVITAFVSKTTGADGLTTAVIDDAALPQRGANGYLGAEIVLQPNDQAWSWILSGWISASADLAGGGTRLTLTSCSAGGKDGDQSIYAPKSRYWLWNHASLLDQPGEWFHDKPAGKLYLRTPDGRSPEGRVEARARRYAFDLSDRAYITVRGFRLIACSITTDRDSGGDDIGYANVGGALSLPVTQRWPHRGAGSVAASNHCVLEQLDVAYPTWFTDVSGHFFTQWGASSGIVVSGSDQVLRRCRIRWSAGNGVSVIGRRNRILDNWIEGACCVPDDCAGIGTGVVANTEDHELAGNTIRATGRSGITPRYLACTTPATWGQEAGRWRARIHHNDIAGFGMQDWDCGAIYGGGSQGWIRIDHNCLHDATRDVDQRPGNGAFSVGGAYLDYARRAVIDHNAIWEVEWGIHLQSKDPAGASDFLVYDNTVVVRRFASAVTYGPFGTVDNSAADYAGTVLRGNLLASSEALAHFVALDDFTNAVQDHNLGAAGTNGSLAALAVELRGGTTFPEALWPTASSLPLIDRGAAMGPESRDGVIIPPFNDPVAGSAPDIGCYEFGQPAWSSGAPSEVGSGAAWTTAPRPGASGGTRRCGVGMAAAVIPFIAVISGWRRCRGLSTSVPRG